MGEMGRVLQPQGGICRRSGAGVAAVLQDFRDRCDALTVCAVAVLNSVYNVVGWGVLWWGVGLSDVCSFSGH